MRKEIAAKEREEEEARLNDPQEQMKIELMEREEAERAELERKEFEEREKAWVVAMEMRKKKMEEEEEEERRRKALDEEFRRKQVFSILFVVHFLCLDCLFLQSLFAFEGQFGY